MRERVRAAYRHMGAYIYYVIHSCMCRSCQMTDHVILSDGKRIIIYRRKALCEANALSFPQRLGSLNWRHFFS